MYVTVYSTNKACGILFIKWHVQKFPYWGDNVRYSVVLVVVVVIIAVVPLRVVPPTHQYSRSSKYATRDSTIGTYCLELHVGLLVIVHKFHVRYGNYAIVTVLPTRKQEESTRGQIRQVERWETTTVFLVGKNCWFSCLWISEQGTSIVGTCCVFASSRSIPWQCVPYERPNLTSHWVLK